MTAPLRLRQLENKTPKTAHAIKSSLISEWLPFMSPLSMPLKSAALIISLNDAYFFWRENGDVIFVDEPGFFFHHFGRVVLFEILTGEPKEDVLLTVFALKELTEDGPTHGASHQTVERVAPAPDLLYARPAFIIFFIIKSARMINGHLHSL